MQWNVFEQKLFSDSSDCKRLVKTNSLFVIYKIRLQNIFFNVNNLIDCIGAKIDRQSVKHILLVI